MNEMKNKKRKENKPTEKTRTHTPLIHITKVKENLTLVSTMEQRNVKAFQKKKKNVEVADKSEVAVKKLELKKYFEKRKGVHSTIEF